MKEYIIRRQTEEAPVNLRAGQILKNLFSEDEMFRDGYPMVAVRFNNEIYSLNSHPDMNGTIKALYLNNRDGIRLYRKTLCYVLEMAVRDLFPHQRLILSHSLGHSYYYHPYDEQNFTDEEIKRIKDKMESLVDEDIPILPDQVCWQEAIDYFRESNQEDTVSLLEENNKSQIRINRTDDYIALRHECLLPSTGLLKIFDLLPYTGGFLLHYPSSKNPLVLQPFEDEPLLFSIYREYKSWGKILNVNTAGKMNAMTKKRAEITHFIRVSESLHNKKIALIADSILEKKGDVRVVLIAGPSSSGKTTFTKKLCTQLQVVGFNPIMISLDNYYLPHDQIPLDEFGKQDLEALDALDIPLLNNNLLQLFSGEKTEFPIFDFKKGGRLEEGMQLQMSDRSILVMEGIHGLNQNLTAEIPESRKFKVYISALTQLNLDDHTRIATTDNRLIRRIVRDHQFRNYDALKTLKIWPSVRRGEDKNIFPNQSHADAAFNSALDYELAVLKVYAEPLIKGIRPDQEEYSEAKRLLSFLDNFSPIPSYMVPADSILREFIGNSSFKY
jgi:uridine kinase